jgi:P27 family predicted phage terminase small subunit
MSRGAQAGMTRSAIGRGGLPRCPAHLGVAATREWRRVAAVLHDMGVVTTIDRAALAAYCQAYGRWVEAEEKLRETPLLFKTPSGYVQQSPWLGIANKQLELMGRYLVELGMTPASRSRVVAGAPMTSDAPDDVLFRIVDPRQLSDEELDRIIRTKTAELLRLESRS